MPILNFAILAERLLIDNKQLELVNYIFKVQGEHWCRLNYLAAAKAIGQDRKTVSRYIKILADKNIVQLRGESNAGELRLNSEIIYDVS